jgi:phosphatidylglycerophosphate synthase
VVVDADALRDWSQRHDGYDVARSALVRAWLTAMHTAAAPLARRRVPPDALTAAGVVAAAAAVAAPGRAGAVCVVATGVLDGLDGAVAVASGRAGARGERVDHTADRITDVLFAAALWRAGAPGPLAVAAASATLAYETARSRLRRSRLRDRPVVTMGERPIRVATVAGGLAVAPTLGATALVVLLVGSAVQTVVATRAAADVPTRAD